MSLSQRLQSIDVDVVRRVRGQHANDDAAPATGILVLLTGCWKCKDLEVTGEFKDSTTNYGP